MFLQAASVLFLALTSTTSSTPLVARNTVAIPLARHFNFTGAAKLLEIDQARAKALRARAATEEAATFPVPVTNTAVSYTAEVVIGTPPKTYDLIVDTGSANTWIGARPDQENLFKCDLFEIVDVTYGSGSFTGDLCTDTVTIGTLVLSDQEFANAFFSSGFSGVDGILGIGPTDLTEGTLLLEPTTTIPTVTDTASTLGLITTKEVGIFFAPTNTNPNTNGEITFGGLDASKYTGSINYVPITSTAPASSYVGIDQSITYGTSRTSVLSRTAGIVDTGTTLLLIASDAFATYQRLTGAVPDSATGLLKITSAQYAALGSLYFTIGSVEYEFTPNAQIWPRSLNAAIGGTPGSIYLIVGNIGSNSGSGLDFINGMTFLERFYTVYNSGAKTFGIATTAFTDATTN